MRGCCKTLFIRCEVIGKGAHEKDIHMKCGYCKTLIIGCEVIGCWCSTLMYADKNHRFRIVLVYNVGRQAPRGDSTIFQQQLQYIQNHHLSTTLRRLFTIDFLATLQVWHQQGDRLLIFMDMNEHILNGPLA